MARKKTVKADATSARIDYFHKYESTRALLERIKTAPVLTAGASGREDDRPVPWSGTKDLQSAEKLARDGWQAGALLLRDGIAKAQSVNAGKKELRRKFVRSYDVAGDECDVSRFISGDPENMIETRRTIAKGKTVKKLRVSVTFGNQVEEEKIREYAVAVACAVSRMESAGNRVELWVEAVFAQAAHYDNAGALIGTGKVFNLATKVKSADGRMHPAALAFSCHPAYMRRIVFAAIDRDPACHSFASDNYGRVAAPVDSAGFLTTSQVFCTNAETDRAISELKRAA